VLEQPLVADGWVVSRRGETVMGRIVTARKAGRVKGVSELEVELSELVLADGRQVRIRTQLFENSGGASRGRDAGAIGTTSGLGAAIGAAAGGGRGAGIGAAAGAAAAVAGVLVGPPTGSFIKVATPTRTIIAPRERCASPHPPPSLSVSFFSIPIVLNTTIRQFTENPMRPKPTISVETTNCLSPSRGYRLSFLNHCLSPR